MPAQTVGQYLIQNILPADVYDGSPLDKKGIAKVFSQLAEKYPDKYVDILDDYNQAAGDAVARYGGVASIGLSDLDIPEPVKIHRDALRLKVKAIQQSPTLTGKQKNDAVVKLMLSEADNIRKMTTEESMKNGSHFGLSASKGFRGNPLQTTQMIYGDLLVADHKDRPIPVAGLHGYGEGVTPAEYFAGSYGARKGQVSVQIATAKSGFLGKEISYAAQRQVITGDDCGAKNVGITVNGDNPEIIGSVLAKTTKGIPAGTVITKNNLPDLEGTKVRIRSLSTCQMPNGVCKMCAGKREQGKFPDTGSYVGITSARSLSEPFTQSALSYKHTGGVAKGKIDRGLQGFAEVEQFFNAPENFKGVALQSTKDGIVQNIIKAPQGGSYVFIDGQKHYADPDMTLTVKKGDSVEAGDVLSDGTPHPGLVAHYKGLGAGRAYFIDKLGQILEKNGIPGHMRHVDSMAKAFYDRVRITNPEGFMGYNPDDVVPYTEIQKDYSPRKGTISVAPKQAVNQYLERPVLHYTIGTRVTPNVIKEMNEEGVPAIEVHKDLPDFEPEVSRIMDIQASDPDWQTQLAGFNLRKSLLKSVTHGSTSTTAGTSYVPKLVNSTVLQNA